MSENKPISFRADEDTEKALTKLCQTSGLDKKEVMRKLIFLGIRHRLLEPDWQRYVIEDELKLYSDKERIRLKSETYLFDLKETSKDKDRRLTNERFILERYLQTRTETERRTFFDNRIHEDRALVSEELRALPAKLPSGKFEVYLNGKRLLVEELLEDGLPKLAFNQERLVKCSRGFHTQGSKCYQCEDFDRCPTIVKERLDFI